MLRNTQAAAATAAEAAPVIPDRTPECTACEEWLEPADAICITR